MKVAVLGAFGLMAEAALHDLAGDRRVTQVRAVDVNVARAKTVLGTIPAPGRAKIEVVESDLAKAARKLSGVDVVLNCAWYELNLQAMELALELGAHYVDLGGLYHTTLKQLKLDSAFRKSGRRAVLGCGSTPGITNMMVARMAGRFKKIETVGIYDASHDPTLTDDAFLPPFSIRTMLAEYVAPAPLWLGGRIKDVPAHSLPETLEFQPPIGRVTCGAVIHSETATLPGYLKDKGVENLFFKIAYPDVVKQQLRMLVAMGFDKNREALRHLSATPVLAKPQDFEVLRVVVTGDDKELTWDCVMRPTKLLTAGAMGVGFTGAIAAGMLGRGHVLQPAGVAAAESMLEPTVFFRELAARKIFEFQETIKQGVLP